MCYKPFFLSLRLSVHQSEGEGAGVGYHACMHLLSVGIPEEKCLLVCIQTPRLIFLPCKRGLLKSNPLSHDRLSCHVPNVWTEPNQLLSTSIAWCTGW